MRIGRRLSSTTTPDRRRQRPREGCMARQEHRRSRSGQRRGGSSTREPIERGGGGKGRSRSQVPAPAASDSFFERFFHLSARGTDVSTEVRAGLTTFMVMSYIIVVNAVIIIGGAQIAGQNVTFPAVVTSTCLVAGIMCA